MINYQVKKFGKIMVFFKDIKPELNLEKVNMPENTLYYVNQSFLSTEQW